MNYKKILIILMMLAVVVGIGYFIYYLFFRTAVVTTIEEAPPAANVNEAAAPLPAAGEGAPVTPTAQPTVPELPAGVSQVADGGLTLVTPLTQMPSIGASISSNGSLSYYDRSNGLFYRIPPDGNAVPLSNKVFYNVSNATFDPIGDKAIIEYPDGSNIMYDFNKGQQVTLPAHWEDFSFDAAGDKLISKSLGTDYSNRFLVVSNPDGSGARAVQELGDNASKVTVAVSPNNSIIATAATGDYGGLDSREVFFIGQYHENYRSMMVEGFDFRPSWSPSGDQLLYSAASSRSDYKPTLWIVDGSGNNIGNNRRTLNVDTWADKCTFSDENTVFCAVPTAMPRGAGLQPTVTDNTPDEIYKIDLITGLQTKIAEPQGEHTVEKLMLAPDGKNLYFTDKLSKTLNKIQLAE